MDRQQLIDASTTSLQAFAALAGWSPEHCRAVGYERWVEHVIAERYMLYSIIAFRKVTSVGLGEAKSFCGSVASNPGPMLHEVAVALAARDVDEVAKILREHHMFGDRKLATSLAVALADAFIEPSGAREVP